LNILRIFESHEIPAIPFKGPLLAALVYGSFGLREFCDLDILVHARDFLKAKELLISCGYRLIIKYGNEYHFLSKQGAVNLDLHHAITPKYFPDPFDFDRLWECREIISFAGTTVSHLRPEDLLLILSVQWSKDYCEQYSQLGKLCDIAELVRFHRLDWELIMTQARTGGTKRMLCLSLFLANDLIGISPPREVLQEIQTDLRVKSLATQVRQRVLTDTPKLIDQNTFWASLRVYPHQFHLRMRERLRDKTLYCLYRLGSILYIVLTPNENDRQLLRLPTFLSFIYYLLRPFRLIRDHGKRILISKIGLSRDSAL
jgi:hypothetical protein